MTKTEAMDKVIKLIALSKTAGPEGSAAHEKAKELMLKHQIAIADLEYYQATKQQEQKVEAVQETAVDILNGLWQLFYPSVKLSGGLGGLGGSDGWGGGEAITKKLVWCAEGGLVKRWVAILADYLSEAYDCVMWRDNGLWVAGTEANIEKTKKALEGFVKKLDSEAVEEKKRRGVADGGGDSTTQGKVNWLQSWRLGRVEEIGQELLKVKQVGISDLLGFGERARALQWVKDNVEME